MKVLGSDLYPNMQLVEEGVVDEYVEYDELYRRSDLISLHAFLNDESRHMINDDSIAKMKDGVIFVNTGRGRPLSVAFCLARLAPQDWTSMTRKAPTFIRTALVRSLTPSLLACAPSPTW